MTTLAAAPVGSPPTASPYRPGARRSARRDLQASMIDGGAYGAMVGLGETYLAAFVIALGIGDVLAGLVTTIPMLVGGLAQLGAPRCIERIGSYKRWVVLCASAQAASFLPLVAAAVLGHLHVGIALAIVSLYWGSGMATGAAWNTWIESLVPRRIRSRFFAHRTRASQLLVLVGFAGGGLLLQASHTGHFEMLAFALLFALAALARFGSVLNLRRQSEPKGLNGAICRVPLREIWGRFRGSSGGRLLSYLVCVQIMVQICGPYFSPYLLRQMRVNYASYMLLLSLVFVAKAVALPAWGRIGYRIGAWRLLWIGGLGIVPASGLWMLSQNLIWLAGVQVLSGCFWAAYELAFFLMFFESIEQRERTSLLTVYQFLNTLAGVIGALVGGAVLLAFAASPAGYATLFGLSSCGRLASLVLLARVPATPVPPGDVGVRTITVRHGAASTDAPVLPSLPDPSRRRTAA